MHRQVKGQFVDELIQFEGGKVETVFGETSISVRVAFRVRFVRHFVRSLHSHHRNVKFGKFIIRGLSLFGAWKHEKFVQESLFSVCGGL